MDDSTVVFQNPINLGGSVRTVQINPGYATIDAQLSGALTNGGLTVTGSAGSGTLELTASNGYTGTTTVTRTCALEQFFGIARRHRQQRRSGQSCLGKQRRRRTQCQQFQPPPGHRQRAGAVAGRGGFSAGSGTHSVNIGGATGALTWGGSNFVSNGQPLIFGSGSDGATLVFQNPVSLGTYSGGQTIIVNSGNAAVDAQMTGAITGGNTAGGLTITGDGGTIEFTASNSYSGSTYLEGGVLRVSNSAALPASSNLVLAEGQLELNAGNFTRSLGRGANQVQSEQVTTAGSARRAAHAR